MKERKTDFHSIIRNNFFILKIVWGISKSRFLIKLIVTIISAILPTLNIIITRYIIAMVESDIEKTTKNFYEILVFIIALISMQVIPRIFTAWNTTLIEPILASKINRSMNEVFIDKAKEFDYKNFEDPEFFDRYTRALNQVDSITHSVFNTFFSIISSSISIISLIALIVSMDWYIIFFAIFGVAMNFLQSIIMSKLNYNTSVRLTPISRKQNYIKRLLYMPQYAKDIKCDDVIDTGKRYFGDAFDQTILILKRYGLKVAVVNTLITLVASVSSSVMMVILFIRLWLGIYKISDYTALTGSVTQLETVLTQFLDNITSLYSNSMYIEDFKYIYYYKGTVGKEKTVVLDTSKPCKIEFKNVYYKYPNAKEYALKNISFVIHAGEKVSIVGLNGSGKTTLIKLILRLYVPESGEIYINGINIEEYNRENLQKSIGAVFQDHYVYAYTIKENIAFEKEVHSNTCKVLDQLGVYSKIEALPEGFQTYMTKEFHDTGINLSGGEAQKICIARALNKTSGLYIFDEPSSALDIISENSMNSVMLNATDKTIILVSHRLSTVIMADKILVLQNGELVEQGNHKELIDKNGIYSNLYQQQIEQYLTKAE